MVESYGLPGDVQGGCFEPVMAATDLNRILYQGVGRTARRTFRMSARMLVRLMMLGTDVVSEPAETKIHCVY
jgi:hypothetical protein